MRTRGRKCVCPLFVAVLATPTFAQPASLSGFSDDATFSLYLNEERGAILTSHWKPDGSFNSTFVISLGRQSSKASVTLTPDAEGRWVKAVYQDDLGPTVYQRTGSEFTCKGPKMSGHGTMPDDMLVFDDEAPALLRQALVRYDVAKGGKQTFEAMILHKPKGGDFTLERRGTSERLVAGRTVPVTQWHFSVLEAELDVLAAPDGRVLLVSGLPWFASGGFSERDAYYVREGYESLRPAAVAERGVSQPKYDVKVETVKVPMRDGVRLATDIYRPAGVRKAPVILTRTPYGRNFSDWEGRYYARRGYVYATQDVRGRFDSEGQFEAIVNEPKDGYDSIEWLARQPWSTGKVGMIGGSYSGMVQWMAAAEHPPHLVTIIPQVSPPDPFHNFPYESGAFGLRMIAEWLARVDTKATAELSPVAMWKVDAIDFDKLLKPLPVMELDKAFLGHENPVWRHWLAHPAVDDYWQPAMFRDKLKGVKIPAFHQSGWYDGDTVGTKLNYLAAAVGRHGPQKLTIGPWDHTETASRWVGEHDYGPEAVIDLKRDYLRWFDHWLKGMDSGIMQEPLVSLFVMGSNQWLKGPTYPLPQTRLENLYLQSSGRANTSKGDGRLSFAPPDASQEPDRYLYNPGDPTPLPGGDRKEVTAARQDILVYTTPVLDKPYTIAGPVSAVLYAATSARDTDWVVRLQDEDADGNCTELWPDGGGGIVRARFRNSMSKPELLEPGRIYEYTIDLWHTAATIAAGHRLRVEVASAAFPAFDRNLNTGGDNESDTRFVSASQAIYHDAAHPSHLILPRIPQ